MVRGHNDVVGNPHASLGNQNGAMGGTGEPMPQITLEKRFNDLHQEMSRLKMLDSKSMLGRLLEPIANR